MSLITTVAPSRARVCTQASPIPEAPPVTNAIFPSTWPMSPPVLRGPPPPGPPPPGGGGEGERAASPGITLDSLARSLNSVPSPRLRGEGQGEGPSHASLVPGCRNRCVARSVRRARTPANAERDQDQAIEIP